MPSGVRDAAEIGRYDEEVDVLVVGLGCAGAAAALFLMASPAALADGLTVNTITGAAPGKYVQPFADLRPIVEPELDSSADISTEAARVSANKQVGLKNCKTITGAPCVGSSEITMQ